MGGLKTLRAGVAVGSVGGARGSAGTGLGSGGAGPGSGGALGIGIGVVVAAAAVGGVVAFRKRRIDEASGENTGAS